MPALLTRMSMRPHLSIASVTMASMAATSVTDALLAMAMPPAAQISSATASDNTDVTLTAAEAVAEEICAAGGIAIANNASVTDVAAMDAMVTEAMERWGRIDILVNNAGIPVSYTHLTLPTNREV